MLLLLILLVVGLLVYSIGNSKVAEIGRLIFACALIAICFELARELGAVEHLQRFGR